MKNQLNYYSGIALITGSILSIIAMTLHPSGGSFEYLLKISNIIIASHSFALLSVPAILFGFWGLTRRLAPAEILATGGFITICIGMFAVTCAAAINGLAMPFFVNQYRDATAEKISLLKPVMRYSWALNHAFDYVFIGAACVAVLLWSVAIIKTKVFPKWVGYLGIATAISAVAAIIAGFVFVDLTGFRVFIAGFVLWVVITGVFLKRQEAVI